MFLIISMGLFLTLSEPACLDTQKGLRLETKGVWAEPVKTARNKNRQTETSIRVSNIKRFSRLVYYYFSSKHEGSVAIPARMALRPPPTNSIKQEV